MPVEVREGMTWELQEAADPVRKLATDIILQGGEGFKGMRNMTPVYAAMRVGVSRAQATVYVVPAWRAGMTPRRRYARPNVAKEFQPRMDAALKAKTGEIVKRIEVMFGTIARHNGFH